MTRSVQTLKEVMCVAVILASQLLEIHVLVSCDIT